MSVSLIMGIFLISFAIGINSQSTEKMKTLTDWFICVDEMRKPEEMVEMINTQPCTQIRGELVTSCGDDIESVFEDEVPYVVGDPLPGPLKYELLIEQTVSDEEIQRVLMLIMKNCK